MTNYRRGVRAEKKTRAWYEAKGYHVVESRGSHGACDLVAVGTDDVVVIQSKSGRKLSTTEYNDAIRRLQTVPNTAQIVRRHHVTWLKYGREPQVEEI